MVRCGEGQKYDCRFLEWEEPGIARRGKWSMEATELSVGSFNKGNSREEGLRVLDGKWREKKGGHLLFIAFLCSQFLAAAL